jgi:hypothetical protein
MNRSTKKDAWLNIFCCGESRSGSGNHFGKRQAGTFQERKRLRRQLSGQGLAREKEKKSRSAVEGLQKGLAPIIMLKDSMNAAALNVARGEERLNGGEAVGGVSPVL